MNPRVPSTAAVLERVGDSLETIRVGVAGVSTTVGFGSVTRRRLGGLEEGEVESGRARATARREGCPCLEADSKGLDSLHRRRTT